jgi:hypothetical protein
MADRKDKSSRKAAQDRWKADQRETARAELPLPNYEMQELFDMLDVEFPRQGCDHTLRLTHAWLVAKGLPVDSVIGWLQENGGSCDCEALANAGQAWQESVRDVD